MKLLSFEPLDSGLFCIDSPEKDLLWAVLKRAIEDHILEEHNIRSSSSLSLNTKRSASAWLFDIQSRHEMSLFWVLEHLSTNTEHAYSAIHKMISTASNIKQIKQKRLGKRVVRS